MERKLNSVTRFLLVVAAAVSMFVALLEWMAQGESVRLYAGIALLLLVIAASAFHSHRSMKPRIKESVW